MKKPHLVLRKLIAITVALSLILTMGGGMSFADTNSGKAATVFTNGVIYTVDGSDWDTKPKQSIAVSADGKIMYVGSFAQAASYIGSETQVIDLGGNTVFPGFVDTHIHPTGTAQNLSGYGREIFLTVPNDIRQIEADIQKFVEAEVNQGNNSYSGGRFSMGVFGVPTGPDHPNHNWFGYGTPAKWLDTISGGKPVSLGSSDGHNRLVSQSLLDLNGITASTTPPAGTSGQVHVYEGEVWGILSGSGATGLITTMGPANPPRPAITEEGNRAILRYFQDMMFEWGYTSMMALSSDALARRMITLEGLGDWHMRVNMATSFTNPTNRANFTTNLNNYKINKAWYEENSDLVRQNTAKFFIDNVVEGGSAWLLEPYHNNDEENQDYRSAPRQNVKVGEHSSYDPVNGELHNPTEEEWKIFISELTEEGIQIHVHAVGDAASRATLDAIEYAQEQNPGINARHTITHLHIVHEDDIPRYGQLGVIASTQPFWHMKEPDWYDDMEVEFLGEERAWKGYPVKSFIDGGATVTFSGDHNVTMENYAFIGIESAVTRNLPTVNEYLDDPRSDWNDPEYLRNPAERVSVKQAVEAYTINGAYQNFMEDEIGSLTVGKWADMIVVDQDIMVLEGNGFLEISKTEVLAAIVAGKVVYGDAGNIAAVDTIVYSDKPEIKINLTEEKIQYGADAFRPAYYSVEPKPGKARQWAKVWKNEAAFAKLLDKGLDKLWLCSSDNWDGKKPKDDSKLVKFPAIKARPTGKELVKPVPVYGLNSWQVGGVIDKKLVTLTGYEYCLEIDSGSKLGKEWQSANGEEIDIPKLPAKKMTYYVRLAPKHQGDTLTAGSKYVKVTVPTYLKAPKMNFKNGVIKLKKGQSFAITDSAAFDIFSIPKGIKINDVTNEKTSWTAAELRSINPTGTHIHIWTAPTAKNPRSLPQDPLLIP